MSYGRLASAGAIRIAFASSLLCTSAMAGNEANFVLYNHHTEAKGTTEVNFLNDVARSTPGEPAYSAQLVEIEKALTDQWMMALYFEGDAIDGSDYAFGGWRIESRYRLYPYGAFLNPVLNVEYGNPTASHRYLLEAVGRTDAEEEDSSHEIESRLILGHDINDGFDIAFNWISDANLNTGNWEFGYAAGLNYTLFDQTARRGAEPGGLGIKEVKLGAELYGGLGDTALGLTLDPQRTEQYAGLNLRAEFENGLHAQVGAALGLTDDSERSLLRLMLGWEFE
ncbi:MAG: hypothetical protein WC829_23305 [Hyphomicrobium sp.]|jgi:hypothetical protein